MAANSVLAKLAVVISANTAQFTQAMSSTQKTLTSFTNGITKLAGTLGVAFGVQQVASFALEISKLAGEADGVSAAFERLPNSTRLMEQLKEATGNTVSELGLMKRAVQASNFDISLQALPRLLEFATLRAQQTGQSVDYLVDSIVTGIGRKSKLILDNLGISAVQLDEALGGASTAASSIGEVADAVGKIAEKNLQNMAGFSDNAATKTQRLSAEWENFRVELGRGTNEVGLMGEGIDALTDLLKNLTTFLASDGSSALWEYLRLVSFVPRNTLNAANAALEYANNLNSLNTAIDDFNKKFRNQLFAGVFEDAKEFNEALKDLEEKAEKDGKKIVILRDEMGRAMAVIKPFTQTVVALNAQEDLHTETLESLIEKQKELNEQFAHTDANDKTRLINIGQQIQAVNKQIAALEALKKLEAADFSNIGFKVPEFGDANFTEADFQDQSIDISIKPEDIESLNAGIDAILGLQYAYDGLTFSVDTSNEAQKEMQDRMKHTADIAANMGEVIGEAFGEAISGQKKFADAMASVIPQLLKLFLGEAMAAIIAAGAKQGAKSGNAIVGVAAAAAGAAAIGALFSKHTGGSSGSIGASVGFNSSKFGGIEKNNEIKITIDGRIQGNDIVYILNRTEQLNGRTRD